MIESSSCDVGINFGGAAAFVAEKGLDVAEVSSIFEQMGSKAVSERVNGYAFLDAKCSDGLFEDALNASV